MDEEQPRSHLRLERNNNIHLLIILRKLPNSGEVEEGDVEEWVAGDDTPENGIFTDEQIVQTVVEKYGNLDESVSAEE